MSISRICSEYQGGTWPGQTADGARGGRRPSWCWNARRRPTPVGAVGRSTPRRGPGGSRAPAPAPLGARDGPAGPEVPGDLSRLRGEGRAAPLGDPLRLAEHEARRAAGGTLCQRRFKTPHFWRSVFPTRTSAGNAPRCLTSLPVPQCGVAGRAAWPAQAVIRARGRRADPGAGTRRRGC